MSYKQSVKQKGILSCTVFYVIKQEVRVKLEVRNEAEAPPGGRQVGLFCSVRRSLHAAGRDSPYRLLS